MSLRDFKESILFRGKEGSKSNCKKGAYWYPTHLQQTSGLFVIKDVNLIFEQLSISVCFPRVGDLGDLGDSEVNKN